MHSSTSASQPESIASTCAVEAPMSVSTPSRDAPSERTNWTGSRASCGTVYGDIWMPSMANASRPWMVRVSTSPGTLPDSAIATCVP